MVVVALFAFPLLLYSGTPDTAASSNSLKEREGNLGAATEKGVLIAQNKVADNTETTTPGGLTDHSQEDPKTQTKREKKRTSPGQKSEPLKRFVPSKKIEADQAVDFPYDI
jgi:hypothetical protein